MEELEITELEITLACHTRSVGPLLNTSSVL